jgi:hypothetical protein
VSCFARTLLRLSLNSPRPFRERRVADLMRPELGQQPMGSYPINDRQETSPEPLSIKLEPLSPERA